MYRKRAQMECCWKFVKESGVSNIGQFIGKECMGQYVQEKSAEDMSQGSKYRIRVAAGTLYKVY